MKETKVRKLTERQRKILDFIRQCIKNKDYPPSPRAIQESTGIPSSVVDDSLRTLERMGYIRRNQEVSRAIELLDKADRRSRSMAAAKRRPQAKTSIWDKPHIKAMLKQPLGSPISLTEEEADIIAKEAFGKRPDLPPGEEYVRRLKSVWAGLLRKKDG